MENFPNLKAGQVALLRAETNTGIVLDEKFKRATKEEQKAYTIYNDVNDAILAAQNIIVERRDIECAIFDQNNAFIKRIEPIK